MLTRRHFVQSSLAAGALTLPVPFDLQAAPRAGLLPPGVSRADFADAMRQMADVVGARNVFLTEPDLAGYYDHFAMTPPERHAPSGAVAPKTLEEILALLRIAREHRIPIWTISTGRNLGYGGPAPCQPGTLVLDLKRMNRVIEINEKHAYAVVEPGVSYKDLYQHLQRMGSKLWIDCAAPGWGGVVGNLLDRGVGYTPMGEHFLSQQCGMQVVLSDGTVIDTGLGGQEGRGAAHAYRYGHGPWVDGLFTQSNFGIVTQLGVQLMPEPPDYRPYMVTFPDDSAIEPLTEALRPLKLAQLIPNAATSTELLWEASVQVRKDQYFKRAGPVPDSVRQRLKSDLKIGAWNFYGALYGPSPIIAASWKVIQGELSRIRGAKFFFADDRVGHAAFAYRAKLMRGEPNMTEFGTIAWIPNAGHVGFGPVVPVDGKLALEQYQSVRSAANDAGFDYFGEFIVGWRDMHHIFMPAFRLDDPAELQRMRELLGRLVEKAAAQHYGVYRTHLDLMDKVAATYSWNDGALGRLNAKLKRALDPAGILAPGKSGIWPT
jgi:4-cresol dehydrogenase (hydroxylating)